MVATARYVLRDEIGVRTAQPWFIKFTGIYAAASAAGTTTTMIDTNKLKEPDNYWRGQYIYFPLTQESREISGFTQASSTVTWLAPIAAATGVTTLYEIWSTFAPLQVHKAIDNAIVNSWPFFFKMGTSRLAILSGVPPIYTMPTTTAIRRVNRVILCVYDSITGVTTSIAGAQNQIVDSAQTFTAADIGKLVVIYTGTDDSAGDIRTVSAVPDANTLTVSDNFTAVIGADVKYRLINLNTEQPQFVPITNYRLDAPSMPLTIWFGDTYAGYEGHFFLLEYEYEFTALTTETMTTDCPKEYVIEAAKAYLYLMKLALSPAAEQKTWSELHRVSAMAAQQYAIRNRWLRPGGVITGWYPGGSYYVADNPFREW